MTIGSRPTTVSDTSETMCGPTTSRESLYSDESWNKLYLSALAVKKVVSAAHGLKGIRPPRSNDLSLDRTEGMIPTELFNFIAWVTGASDVVAKGWKVNTSVENKCKILSICQDIIYLSSRG